MLYNENEAWKKKNLDNCFDVIMDSYDKGEGCELVGTLILSTLGKSISEENCSLYKDNGLILMINENRQKRKESENR